ncbi:MAG: hypothetical protein MZW92_77160 [Comamonadaceae bacterium]|nr:hypothetical protein [Comamonadaceae bacterium]
MNASILDFLKANGERLDAEIAEALQVPVTLVTSHVSQLSSAGEVICCKVTRYIDGQEGRGRELPAGLQHAGAGTGSEARCQARTPVLTPMRLELAGRAGTNPRSAVR